MKIFLAPVSRFLFVLHGACQVAVLGSAGLGAQDRFTLEETAAGVELKAPGGRTVLQYMVRIPEGTALTANSACCFYPLHSPGGTRVVDFAPDDHKHHRGVFLAWHNVRGGPGGDFWGWGEFAPTEGRVIRNAGVRLAEGGKDRAVLEVRNEWLAQEEVLIGEALTATVREVEGAYVLDLLYVLTPQRDLTLGQTAFSGFMVRSRKVPSQYRSPDGVVDLPAPHHLKPEQNWPTKGWYDYSFTLEDGAQAGVTVIDHKDNPATSWHNPQAIAMVNPCIVAPGEVKLTKSEPLVLRYRLLVHDGPAPLGVIGKEAAGFARE